MRKLIILDRDGVINQDSPDYIRSPEEWIPIDGSLEAIAALNKAGFQVAVATNQSGIGRNYFDESALEKIHNKMFMALKDHGGEIAQLEFCPHLPTDNSSYRKPAPGMLIKISEDLGYTKDEVIFVGDSEKDIQAAKNFGAKPVLVLTGNGFATRHHLVAENIEVDTYAALAQFTEHFLLNAT